MSGFKGDREALGKGGGAGADYTVDGGGEASFGVRLEGNCLDFLSSGISFSS